MKVEVKSVVCEVGSRSIYVYRVDKLLCEVVSKEKFEVTSV